MKKLNSNYIEAPFLSEELIKVQRSLYREIAKNRELEVTLMEKEVELRELEIRYEALLQDCEDLYNKYKGEIR